LISSNGAITEIADSTGDGRGHDTDSPKEVAVDGSGVAHVVCYYSDNVFAISSSGVITEIKNSNGDGEGHTSQGASSVAVNGFGDAYVAGYVSNNVFEISSNGVMETGRVTFY